MQDKRHPICAEVQSNLLKKRDDDRYQVHPRWSEHVAGCDLCRKTFMLVIPDLLGHRQDVALHVSCEACQRDLAAYVDLKQAHGNRSAAKRYPHVWWHLWTCAECAEIYEWMLALVEAEANGKLEAFPFAGLFATQIKTVSTFLTFLTCLVPRSALTLTLGASTLLGDIRGSEHEMMLIDDDVEGYHVCVAVSQIQGAVCSLDIAIQPPVAGWVMVSLGEQDFKAVLNDQGGGQVSMLPLHLLQDAIGPDLLIAFQTELPA
jgi:hypothetical protein